MGGELSRVPERVLVLGGTGFLGSRIACDYLAAGSDVTLLTRRDVAVAPTVGARTARVLLGRRYDVQTLVGAVAGTQHVVYALGGLNPAEASRDASGGIARSIPLLVRVLDQVRAAPGVGLTYLSSGGAVYGEVGAGTADETHPCQPLSAYGIGKLAAENYVAMYAARYGIPARIVRVGNAYGPDQPVGRGQGLVATLVDAVLSGRPVQVYGDGGHVRDYVHVDDVATAVVALSGLARGPLVVNVGTGVGHSIRDVVRLVERAAGTTLSLHALPGRDFDVAHNVLDVTRLRSLIDWMPTPLVAGVQATYAAQFACASEQARSA